MGQVDVLATIADVIGAELGPGQGEDSSSFLPLLRSESEDCGHRRERWSPASCPRSAASPHYS